MALNIQDMALDVAECFQNAANTGDYSNVIAKLREAAGRGMAPGRIMHCLSNLNFITPELASEVTGLTAFRNLPQVDDVAKAPSRAQIENTLAIHSHPTR
jgi:hypothetical protein